MIKRKYLTNNPIFSQISKTIQTNVADKAIHCMVRAFVFSTMSATSQGNIHYHWLVKRTVSESLTIIYFSNLHRFVFQSHQLSSNVRDSNISHNKGA